MENEIMNVEEVVEVFEEVTPSRGSGFGKGALLVGVGVAAGIAAAKFGKKVISKIKSKKEAKSDGAHITVYANEDGE